MSTSTADQTHTALGTERVQTSEPLSDLQLVIVVMLSRGTHNYYSIAEYMVVSPRTVKFHAQQAALKIPGDLPTQFRVVAWFRGATLEVLGAPALLSSSDTISSESPTGGS